MTDTDPQLAEDLGADARSLVLLSSHAAAGRAAGLDAELMHGLGNGVLGIDELLEFVLHIAVYAGWPKAAQAEMSVREQWHRSHRERGLDVPPWPEAESFGSESVANRNTRGAAMFETVNMFPAPFGDSPFFQLGLVSFVFGEVWTRPGLSRRQRRLVTLPCVAESGVQAAIDAHVTSALRSADLTTTDVNRVAEIVEAGGSTSAASLLRETLRAQG